MPGQLKQAAGADQPRDVVAPAASDRDADLAVFLAGQQRYWNAWNSEFREDEARLPPVNRRQAEQVLDWLAAISPGVPLDIVEVGCGSGWLCERMRLFGGVTGIDLSDEVLERSRSRFPQVRFVAGDFLAMELPAASADVVVTLEVLSHVADQREFVDRLARLLRPGGKLILATQNRFVLERCESVRRVLPPQLRRWVSPGELRSLLGRQFDLDRLTSLYPTGHLGVLRMINSYRASAMLERLGLARSYERMKERMLLGHTLIVLARRRADGPEAA